MEPEKAQGAAPTTPAAPAGGPSPLAFRLNPLVLFLGLGASLMLLADYTQSAPVFCTEAGSGCAALRRSAFSHLGPIPLPALGIAGLSLLFLLGLVRGKLAARLHAGVGLVAALAASVLFAFQVAKGQYCQFCLVVDTTALLAGLIGLLRIWQGWEPPARDGVRVAHAVVFSAAVGLVAWLTLTKQPALPSFVAEELARTPKGKVLVLDFLDFECPFCRDAHAVTRPFVEAHADQIRLVRKHVPLAMHPHALPAAKAGLCGERFGQGEPMLERLFALEPEKMNTTSFVAVARDLGIDEKAFTDCMVDPAWTERLALDKATWKSVGAEGLPTLYIGSHRFVGSMSAADVQTAFDEALKDAR